MYISGKVNGAAVNQRLSENDWTTMIHFGQTTREQTTEDVHYQFLMKNHNKGTQGRFPEKVMSYFEQYPNYLPAQFKQFFPIFKPENTDLNGSFRLKLQRWTLKKGLS